MKVNQCVTESFNIGTINVNKSYFQLRLSDTPYSMYNKTKDAASPTGFQRNCFIAINRSDV